MSMEALRGGYVEEKMTHIVTDFVERVRRLRRQTERRAAVPKPVAVAEKKSAFGLRFADQVIPHKRVDDHHLRSSQF
jgi:hypothetical protein